MALARQTFDPKRTALVLIEFQREWLDPTGRLNSLMRDRTQFAGAVKAGSDLLKAARTSALPVFHVSLRFSEGHPELGHGGQGLREAIPRVGTFVGHGADFVAPFAPAPSEFVVSGRLGASGFAASNLDGLLRNQGIDTLLLAGFALHVCVESTLRQAHDLGYRALLVEDACAAFTTEQRQHVLDHVVQHFGAVISLADVQVALASDPGANRIKELA